MNVNLNAPTLSTIAGAISGIAQWALQTYAFKHGTVPGTLQVELPILIGAIVTGVASLLTKKKTTTDIVKSAALRVKPWSPTDPPKDSGGIVSSVK